MVKHQLPAELDQLICEYEVIGESFRCYTLYNVDTNTVEQFNSIICKHIGGKRINYCSRRSLQARCEASAVEWNTKHFVSILSQSLTGRKPAVSKKIEKRYTRRRKICVKKRSWQKSNNKDYGECCKKPDLDDEGFKVCKEDYIAENFRKTSEDGCKLWHDEREKRITASNFGDVCKMLPKTSRKRLVEQIIYPKYLSTPAIMHGKQYEEKALEALEIEVKQKILKCGLYVDKDPQFLGDSPDGVLQDGTAIIEVKCPYSAKSITPQEGIENGKITFWRKKTGATNTMNKAPTPNRLATDRPSHKWYYQIQGQLHVTGYKKCIFGVWTFKGIKITEIERDENFSKSKMQGPLQNFFDNHSIKELVDPRKIRNMPLRD
ncbi:uncharacterized protein [Leptinotarsa decemlineata]|uniref:uncharacterized protein n=1 Tax=Leptinotarsa decemlineata TaxID=7539 RepID=UPI003D305CE0